MRQNQGKTYWYLAAEPNLDETHTMQDTKGQTFTNEPGSLWRKLQKYIGTWLPEHYM
jgi:hypothetical protein